VTAGEEKASVWSITLSLLAKSSYLDRNLACKLEADKVTTEDLGACLLPAPLNLPSVCLNLDLFLSEVYSRDGRERGFWHLLKA
jgi:hypothetical protein